MEVDHLVEQLPHQHLFEQDPQEEVDHRLVEQLPLHLAEQEPLLAPLLALVHGSNTEVKLFPHDYLSPSSDHLKIDQVVESPAVEVDRLVPQHLLEEEPLLGPLLALFRFSRSEAIAVLKASAVIFF